MLVRSREVFVGFLLVLALAACGQDSAQDNAQSATKVPPVATVGNTPTAAALSVSETVPATPTTAPSAQESPTTPVTTTAPSAQESSPATITTTAPSEVTESNTVTTSSALTTAIEISTSVVTTAAGASEVSSPSEAADPALLAAGLAAYHANYCGVCHTLDKAETLGTFGPVHNGLAADVAVHLSDGTYQGAAKTPAEYVHESIVDPQAYVVPGYAATSHRMPSYAHLDEATLNALVAFLLAP